MSTATESAEPSRIVHRDAETHRSSDKGIHDNGAAENDDDRNVASKARDNEEASMGDDDTDSCATFPSPTSAVTTTALGAALRSRTVTMKPNTTRNRRMGNAATDQAAKHKPGMDQFCADSNTVEMKEPPKSRCDSDNAESEVALHRDDDGEQAIADHPNNAKTASHDPTTCCRKGRSTQADAGESEQPTTVTDEGVQSRAQSPSSPTPQQRSQDESQQRAPSLPGEKKSSKDATPKSTSTSTSTATSKPGNREVSTKEHKTTQSQWTMRQKEIEREISKQECRLHWVYEIVRSGNKSNIPTKFGKLRDSNPFCQRFSEADIRAMATESTNRTRRDQTTNKRKHRPYDSVTTERAKQMRHGSQLHATAQSQPTMEPTQRTMQAFTPPPTFARVGTRATPGWSNRESHANQYNALHRIERSTQQAPRGTIERWGNGNTRSVTVPLPANTPAPTPPFRIAVDQNTAGAGAAGVHQYLKSNSPLGLSPTLVGNGRQRLQGDLPTVPQADQPGFLPNAMIPNTTGANGGSAPRPPAPPAAAAAASLLQGVTDKQKKPKEASPLVNFAAATRRFMPTLNVVEREVYSRLIAQYLHEDSTGKAGIHKLSKRRPKRLALQIFEPKSFSTRPDFYEDTNKNGVIFEPGPNDMVFGNLMGLTQHVGCKRFRHWIKLHQKQYENLTEQHDKFEMLQDLAHDWVNRQYPPGRFLIPHYLPPGRNGDAQGDANKTAMKPAGPDPNQRTVLCYQHLDAQTTIVNLAYEISCRFEGSWEAILKMKAASAECGSHRADANQMPSDDTAPAGTRTDQEDTRFMDAEEDEESELNASNSVRTAQGRAPNNPVLYIIFPPPGHGLLVSKLREHTKELKDDVDKAHYKSPFFVSHTNQIRSTIAKVIDYCEELKYHRKLNPYYCAPKPHLAHTHGNGRGEDGYESGQSEGDATNHPDQLKIGRVLLSLIEAIGDVKNASVGSQEHRLLGFLLVRKRGALLQQLKAAKKRSRERLMIHRRIQTLDLFFAAAIQNQTFERCLGPGCGTTDKRVGKSDNNDVAEDADFFPISKSNEHRGHIGMPGSNQHRPFAHQDGLANRAQILPSAGVAGNRFETVGASPLQQGSPHFVHVPLGYMDLKKAQKVKNSTKALRRHNAVLTQQIAQSQGAIARTHPSVTPQVRHANMLGMNTNYTNSGLLNRFLAPNEATINASNHARKIGMSNTMNSMMDSMMNNAMNSPMNMTANPPQHNHAPQLAMRNATSPVYPLRTVKPGRSDGLMSARVLAMGQHQTIHAQVSAQNEWGESQDEESAASSQHSGDNLPIPEPTSSASIQRTASVASFSSSGSGSVSSRSTYSSASSSSRSSSSLPPPPLQETRAQVKCEPMPPMVRRTPVPVPAPTVTTTVTPTFAQDAVGATAAMGQSDELSQNSQEQIFNQL